MIFNSVAFLVFYAIFFYVYWWINNAGTVKWRNGILIIASYIFYGWWDWRFLILIAFSSAADFILGQKIHQAQSLSAKKTFLIASLAINLGILGFFKYFNFFIHSAEILLSSFSIPLDPFTLQIILPVGISFYTFQTMSYSIDIYRNQISPTKSWLQFFAFVSFFPQLVAGPIERAQRFLPQFETKKVFDPANATAGLRLILWGFFKKIVIADNLSILVDQVFRDPETHSGLGIMLGSVAFAFQIYCDFSGYSDIAIGLGKTMGFDLMTNFKKPYFSASFKEFWGRWHISLSIWFRDYVYIPVGGNRLNRARTDLNLLITFLLSGLWHGANYTFIIWGFMHGSILILEKRVRFLQNIGWVPVFIITSLFWIPFRAEDTTHFFELLNNLCSLNLNTTWIKAYFGLKLYSLITLFLVFLLVEWKSKHQNFGQWVQSFSGYIRMAIYFALAFAILLLGNFNVKPSFIYFQF